MPTNVVLLYTVDASNNTIAWKQIDKNHFERKLFEDNKLLTTREIQISDGGKTLTEETTRTLPDGMKKVTTINCQRRKGEGQGLAGMWQEKAYQPQGTSSRSRLRLAFGK